MKTQTYLEKIRKNKMRRAVQLYTSSSLSQDQVARNMRMSTSWMQWVLGLKWIQKEFKKELTAKRKRMK